jgi:hypothetical protein
MQDKIGDVIECSEAGVDIPARTRAVLSALGSFHLSQSRD